MKKLALLFIPLLLFAFLTSCSSTQKGQNSEGISGQTNSDRPPENSQQESAIDGVSGQENSASVPDDAIQDASAIEGVWREQNSASENTYFEATISGDTIEINWISNNGDTKTLYWYGSYEAPSDSADSHSWESVRDKEKTENAIFASGDDTKTFTITDGVLSYSASVLGITETVKMEKAE